MELVDAYRDHHLPGARMIAKKAAELAQSAKVTLTRIEWLHGHEIADWCSSSLKLDGATGSDMHDNAQPSSPASRQASRERVAAFTRKTSIKALHRALRVTRM